MLKLWNVYFNIDTCTTQSKLLINRLGIHSNIIHVWNGWWSCVLQEIVGNLVTHFGSGFEEETDSSLDILYYLVDNLMRWHHLQSLSNTVQNLFTYKWGFLSFLHLQAYKDTISCFLCIQVEIWMETLFWFVRFDL